MTDKERKKAFQQARKEELKQRTAILADTRAEVIRLLDVARVQIAATLASSPTEYQSWYLPQLQAEIQRVLAEFGSQAGGVVAAEASGAWEAGKNLIDNPLQAAGIRLAGMVPSIDTRQLVAMRSFMTDRIKDVAIEAANKINAELGLVMIGANSVSDAIARVADILGDPVTSRATTIVRTELGRAYAVAAHERMLQAKESVPGLKKLWRRSGKIHSRLHHDAADGQIKDVDKPFIIHGKTGAVKMMHPHDPKAPAGEVINCGCVMLPHMASWDMATPGKKPFSDLELANSSIKRALSEARPVPKAPHLKHSSENLAAFAKLVDGSKLFGANFVGPIMEQTGASVPEAAALADYLHDGYRDVNQALRGTAPSQRLTAKELDGYVEAMSGMIDKLPRPYEPSLIRVLGDMNDETRAKVIDAYQHIGQEVRYNEFLSTSAPGGEFTALNRSQVELKIKPAQGSRRAGVVGDLSPYHHEKEVLYKAGSRFRVLDIRPLAGDRIRIVLEEIE